VLDYETRFRAAVIDDFADTYLKGETPIPCVRCNQTVKFTDLLEMARDLGCDVVQASGGEQALTLIDKLSPPPKLILLDYAMPGMNGLQLARELRDRGVTAPIALVTGYAELSEADIGVGQLAGLLRKPFTIRELQALLVQLRAAAAGGQRAQCPEAGLIEG